MDDFISQLMYYLPSLLLLYVLLEPKGRLTREILRVADLKQEGEGRISIGQAILCRIPIVNTFMIRNTMYGTKGFYPITYILFALLFTASVIFWFLMTPSDLSFLIFTSLLFSSLLILWVTESLIILDCSLMFGSGWFVRIVGTLIPPLGAQVTSSNVQRILYESDEEDVDTTFEGNGSLD